MDDVVSETKMCKISYISIIILYLSLDYAHHYQIAAVDKPDYDFDTVMLSQNWPVTKCKNWIDLNPSHQCSFPDKKDRWTLHGIRPLKWTTEGPSFCNDTWVFDPEEIKSIEGDLEQAWTDVYKGQDSHIFWSHEWNKHGTCGAVLTPLNSQFKYFNKGIEWNQKYSLSDMLSAANILPSDTRELTVEELKNAVKVKTGKQPIVECGFEKGVQYILELILCFDKKLNVIDCEPAAEDNCDLTKGIIYPVNV